ncbi:DUF397 domain-containing protein [Nocardia callitridis]|uniref:DUF397 domain-containing protein n=1 Tax=Nocardia callitridis TaxID=648753 RepID=A0ABP9KRH6_9NOCA
MQTDISGAEWFKSTRSGNGHECVEVAHLASGLVGVRDSKNPAGPALVFAPEQWDAFLGGLADGSSGRS